MVQLLQAVVFDMDGVIADTEPDGHRVAFNQTFRELGIDVEWDIDTYGELLKVSGGKERMRHYFMMHSIPFTDDSILQLHKRKTAVFQELIQSGRIQARPGIRQFVQSITDAGVKLALATTSNEKAARTLLKTLLGTELYARFDAISLAILSRGKNRTRNLSSC